MSDIPHDFNCRDRTPSEEMTTEAETIRTGTKTETLQPGQLVLLSSGTYHYYTIQGLFRVLKPCDVTTWNSYEDENPPIKQEPWPIIEDLIAAGFIEPVEYVEFGVGDELGRRSVEFKEPQVGLNNPDAGGGEKGEKSGEMGEKR